MYRPLITLFILMACFLNVNAQEIRFSDYGNYTHSVTELTAEDLAFGQIVSNSGQHIIDISNAKVVALTGVKYLDIIVEINALPSLYLNGNEGFEGDTQRSIPFTLQASYANKAQNNISHSRVINVVNNSAVVRFPLLAREHLPPGPPPEPPTNAFDQAAVEETAYIYLYGSVNIGQVNAGPYSTTIEISITYD